MVNEGDIAPTAAIYASNEEPSHRYVTRSQSRNKKGATLETETNTSSAYVDSSSNNTQLCAKLTDKATNPESSGQSEHGGNTTIEDLAKIVRKSIPLTKNQAMKRSKISSWASVSLPVSG